ncbi:hypothetical protein PR202_gb15347 [Eleusine coracana subsp. coracana]|uniref:TEX10-like TPR repeats domain-containing protein n=1 Tax=Eleusine coracana subsp. coracana TaxID=191504 RepID=A0AAV5EWX7_ELECO|nr:hypothetical protein PR202_gb15347 [Eleusine coracana subsp. coracana]
MAIDTAATLHSILIQRPAPPSPEEKGAQRREFGGALLCLYLAPFPAAWAVRAGPMRVPHHMVGSVPPLLALDLLDGSLYEMIQEDMQVPRHDTEQRERRGTSGGRPRKSPAPSGAPPAAPLLRAPEPNLFRARRVRPAPICSARAAAAFPSPSALPSERARPAQIHVNTGAMGRPKGGGASASSSSKKQKAKPKQRGGVDFKKYKHKVGRKLPPPKNATNTEIKFKAIVLPEQSMASERAGMAVNKRGLTLRELLQQTGHYNANVRRAALNGIKDIVVKHPTELKLHKVAIIEKLQERICDSDKVVRESLYSLLQSQIIPSLKQLMAFRFLELVVLNFPSSFTSYSEQAFDNFIAVLSNDRIQLDDRNKLNSILSGLGHCLSLVAKTSNNGDTSNRQAKTHRNKDLVEIYLSPLITALPGLISNAPDDSKGYLLEAFTDAFRDCKVDCKLILPYLDAVGEMLLDEEIGMSCYHGSWIHELPGILLRSIDKAPSVTKVVLELLLRVGQNFPTTNCENLRTFIKLFGVRSSSGLMELGPFVNLPRDCQELAISCLYYFPSLLPDIIGPLASCCLSDTMEPFILFRVAEILQSIYKAGHLLITEQLSFLLLLMARFKVHPEDSSKAANWDTFKSLNRLILTSLSEMGDGSLVLELMWSNLSNAIAQKPSMHNMNGLFRIIVTLNAGTSKVLNEDIIKLIAGYLVDASLDLSKTIETGFQPEKTRLFQYFIKPCIIMFEKNDKSTSGSDVTYEEKQKLKSAFEQLKTKALQLNCWATNLKEMERVPCMSHEGAVVPGHLCIAFPKLVSYFIVSV